MGNRRGKVFLSYSSKDKSKARRLAQDLRAAGVDVWFDEFELRPGDPILSVIRAAIDEASHLLVLISNNSKSSHWVENELQEAFTKNRPERSPTIIPVRIDDAEVPEFLRSVLYVDLRTDYEAGLRALLDALVISDQGPRVSEVLDPSQLAKEIAQQQDSASRGAGFWVSTVLSGLTIIATLVAAWPAFYQAFGEKPRIYYSVTPARLTIPAALDQAKIQQMLKDAGIPDSNLRIEVVNRGAKKAGEVKIGIKVNGALASFSSEPPASSDPVWVTIKPPPIREGASDTSFTLNDLVPNRQVTASVAYFSAGEQFSCDVVADGSFAQNVQDVATVREWSLWNALKTPLLILLGGITASLLIATVVASLENKRFREIATEFLKIVSPVGGAVVGSLIEALDATVAREVDRRNRRLK